MSKKTEHSIRELLADIDGMSILIEHDEDDDTWSATGNGFILGEVGGFPADNFIDALDDVKWAIEQRLIEVVIGQLTRYQAAMLMSAAVVNHRGIVDWSHTQQLPTTIRSTTAVMLDEMGLIVCSGNPRDYTCDYGSLGPVHRVPGSGYKLTEWGVKVLGELHRTKLAEHPKTVEALARLRLTPETITNE
jgi:hypothetical protein